MLTALFVFLVGLCIGSFLNVVVFRTFEERSFVSGRSRCPSCDVPLEPVDLVPVVSWLALRGKCRSCSAPISWQYPAVELATGALFVIAFLHATGGWFVAPGVSPTAWIVLLMRDWIFVSFLVVLFVYDLRFTLILDRFTVPAGVIAILLNLWIGMPIESLLLGGLALGGFFFAQHLVSKGAWVGGGDIRMGVMIGFMLGLQNAIAALFISYMLGAVVGVYLLARRKTTWRGQLPFGTFLAIGALIMLFSGEGIVNWYLGLLW